jgi:hypothetical protein
LARELISRPGIKVKLSNYNEESNLFMAKNVTPNFTLNRNLESFRGLGRLGEGREGRNETGSPAPVV